MYAAALFGHMEVVCALVEAGANLDQVGRHGHTPLNQAAFEGRVKVVNALVEAGADLNQAFTPGDGATPLYGAVMKGHVEVVRALVGAGADLKKEDRCDGGEQLDLVPSAVGRVVD